MSTGIKARYWPLDLPPLNQSRFVAMQAASRKKDVRYCIQIVQDTMVDLRDNDVELRKDSFEVREQVVEAVCRAVPYNGAHDLEERTNHLRAFVLIGWAIGVREEVSGLAELGMAELHYLNALTLALARNNVDEQDWAANEFAINAGYYLARVGDRGIEAIRSHLAIEEI
jgi:hypothetical protein